MRRARRNLNGQRPYVYGKVAAKILGIGKTAFWRRFYEGNYPNIRRQQLMTGWVWDMIDVFETAYPMADDNTISLLVGKFREETTHKEKML